MMKIVELSKGRGKENERPRRRQRRRPPRNKMIKSGIMGDKPDVALLKATVRPRMER